MDTLPADQPTNPITPGADLAGRLWQRYVTKPGVISPVLTSRLPLLTQIQGRLWPSVTHPAAQPGVRYIWRQKNAPSLPDRADFATVDHETILRLAPKVVSQAIGAVTMNDLAATPPAIRTESITSPINLPGPAANDQRSSEVSASPYFSQREVTDHDSIASISPASTPPASATPLTGVSTSTTTSSAIARTRDTAAVQHSAGLGVLRRTEAGLIPSGPTRTVITNQSLSTSPIVSNANSSEWVTHSALTSAASNAVRSSLSSMTTTLLPARTDGPGFVAIQRQPEPSNTETPTRLPVVPGRTVVSQPIIADHSDQADQSSTEAPTRLPVVPVRTAMSQPIITDHRGQAVPKAVLMTDVALQRTTSQELAGIPAQSAPAFPVRRLTNKGAMINQAQWGHTERPSPASVQSAVSGRSTDSQSAISDVRDMLDRAPANDLQVRLDTRQTPAFVQRIFARAPAAYEPPAIRRATNTATHSTAVPRPAEVSPPTSQTNFDSLSSDAAGVDLTRLADEVYTLLERRMTIERERLGL